MVLLRQSQSTTEAEWHVYCLFCDPALASHTMRVPSSEPARGTGWGGGGGVRMGPVQAWQARRSSTAAAQGRAAAVRGVGILY